MGDNNNKIGKDKMMKEEELKKKEEELNKIDEE